MIPHAVLARIASLVLVLLAIGSVLACSEKTGAPIAKPLALEVDGEAIGHYCGMRLAEHDGPKGQIHLSDRAAPLWFSSVRDALVFLRSPEEPRNIVAAYVNDMGRSRHWEQPDPGTWIEVEQAWYVIGSDTRGGMGAPEAVPFSTEAAAEHFRASHGGELVRLDGIPDAYLHGETGDRTPIEHEDAHEAGAHDAAHDEAAPAHGAMQAHEHERTEEDGRDAAAARAPS